jgi:hypothetical protein
LKNGNGWFGSGWRKRIHKRRGREGGTEKGWGWLVNGSGYRGLFTISVAHLSIRDARNTKGTKGTPE